MNALPVDGRPLLDEVRTALSRTGTLPSRPQIAHAVRRAAGVRGAGELLRAVGEVDASLRGLGPLQHLLAEPGVTDILVNGPREIWVDCGVGLQRRAVDLGDEAGVRALAVRLAAISGRRLDEATAYVDGRLPGGVRLHAVLPPIATDGTLISLRVPARQTLTMTELVAMQSLPPTWCTVLSALVRARVGFIVSGATGTGKTTLLAAVLGLGDPADRVVLVEDTAELEPDVPHYISVQARHPNSEGAGGVRMADLVRQALRMRPDRLVVGECRGEEVTDLLAALNTGHSGCGTVHANSAVDVPSRLEALGLLAGVPRAALQRQIASGLKAVVHLERDQLATAGGPGLRRVATIGVVVDDGERVRVSEALVNTGAETRVGPGWRALAEAIGWSGDAP